VPWSLRRTVARRSCFGDDRPVENKLSTATETLARYSYAEDAVGNITRIHDVTDSTYDRDFDYDDLSRLVTANSGASLWGSGGYTCDAMGNLLSSTVGNRTSVLSYSGTTPKLTQSVDDGNTTAMTYDVAGNETVHADERTYSSRNLLQAIQTTRSVRSCPTCPLHPVTTTETFLYDGRCVRVEWDHESFLTRQYVYTPELHLLARTGFDSVVTDTFVWFADRPVAQFTPGSSVPVRYTFTDHLGTPLIQTDDAGAIVWRAEYEPYGHITAIRQGVEETLDGYDRDEQPLRLPGQEFRALTESGTEEDYNIFRWYRSGWGRYTQADPRGVEEGVNLFAYVSGNPVIRIDPFGLAATEPYRRCKLLKETIVSTIRTSDLPEIGDWIADTPFDIYLPTKWKCKWRCYCEDLSKSCPKIPCKNGKCALDHGIEVITDSLGFPAQPCRTTVSAARNQGKCGD